MTLRRISKFDAFSSFFFLLYFLSYIGEVTTVKYAAIVFFQIYLFLRVKRSDFSRRDKWFAGPIILILTTLAISMCVNYNPSGMVKTVSLMDLYVITYFMFSKVAIRLHVDETKFIGIITNTLFVALLLAFLLYYDDVVVGNHGRQSLIAARHQFGFGAASIVGFLCFVEFTLSFYLFKVRQKKLTRNITIIAKLLLPLVMAVLADIRASLVAMAFFLMIFAFHRLPKNKTMAMIKTVLILAFLVISMIFIFSASFGFEQLDYALSHRFFYFQRAINEVVKSNSVLFGVGSFRNSDVFTMNRVQIDNAFLDIFYQYGILAMLLFLFVSVKIAVELLRISRNSEAHGSRETVYSIFIVSYYFSVLMYSMVEKNLFSISSALSLVSFLLVFWYIEKNKPEPQSRL